MCVRETFSFVHPSSPQVWLIRQHDYCTSEPQANLNPNPQYRRGGGDYLPKPQQHISFRSSLFRALNHHICCSEGSTVATPSFLRPLKYLNNPHLGRKKKPEEPQMRAPLPGMDRPAVDATYTESISNLQVIIAILELVYSCSTLEGLDGIRTHIHGPRCSPVRSSALNLQVSMDPMDQEDWRNAASVICAFM